MRVLNKRIGLSLPASRIPHPASDSALRSLRTAFGLVMAGSTLRFWLNGWAEDHFAPGRFAFHYYGLGWVPHPGAWGLQALLAAQLLGALAMLYRPWARVAAGVFGVPFVWMQALDATWYLNHYYFVALMALGLAVVPGTAGRATGYAVAWFRVQIALLYLFAGLFKLEPDWLLRAQPLRIWLASRSNLPGIGPLLALPVTPWLFAWGGLLYDCLIPFFLLRRKTALWAYGAVVIFHTLVGLLFDIGIFPYLMVGVTPFLFPQDWHLKFWAYVDTQLPQLSFLEGAKHAYQKTQIASNFLFTFFILYFGFQILFPLRYLLYPGNILWHEQGIRFSWRVMLMEKVGTAAFYVQDSRTKRWGLVDNSHYLTPIQERMMATQPDFILQYAHYLSRHYAQPGQAPAPVRAEVYVTLNGRPSRLFIDPNRDLSTIEDGWGAYGFVAPYP